MSFEKRPALDRLEPTSLLKGTTRKALAILALVAAVYTISPARLFAAPGTLQVVNTKNESPVVIDWAPMVRGAAWIRLPTVAANWQATFSISLPEGAVGIYVRADENDETIEEEAIDGTDYYFEPYP